MSALWQDLKYAVRTLTKRPGFTAVAVLTIALGIGANTAIFSVIYGVLLRPLPYPNADRIVRAWSHEDRENIRDFSFRVVEYRALAEQQGAFAAVGADFGVDFTITGVGDTPERVAGSLATPDYFDVFGVTTLWGRVFTAADLAADDPHVAVVTHGFWTRRLGSDLGAVGRPLTLGGTPFTVIGVLEPDFVHVNGDAEVFIPYTIGTERWIGRWLELFGVLAPDASLARAQEELNTVMQRLGETERRTAGWRATLVPLYDMVVGNVRPALLAIFATVVLVLLISCANVANLFLARTATREREVTVRMALGAGRGRIARQVLVESLTLAGVGGLVGALLAVWAVGALVALAPADIPRLDGVTVDTRVLAFTVVVSIVAGLIFGVTPALHAARATVGGGLRGQTRGVTPGRRGQGLLGFLVVSEVGLALMLLVGAGLMIKSFTRLRQVDMGFNADNVLAVQVAPPVAKYPEPVHVRQYYDRLAARLEAIPGTRTVGVGSDLPLSGEGAVAALNSEDRFRAGITEHVGALQRVVNPSFFDALAAPLLSGRVFTAADGGDAPPRLVINDALARQLFPDGNAVGKRVATGQDPSEDDWHEVVGVVGDVKYENIQDASRPTMYEVQAAQTWRVLYVFVRTALDPENLISSVRGVVREIDADVPVYDVTTLRQVVDRSLAAPRFNTWLLGLFGGVALLLAAAGIYGVLSFVVSQRNREIGIRMAMGAPRGSVLGIVLRRGMSLVAAGSLLGVMGAFGLTRLLESLLYEVSSRDVATFASMALVLGVVALLACFVPARRASFVDPIEVLREE